MTTRLSIDELTTKTRRRFTAQQKAEAVALCLQEGLS
jgi:transposase-like protein